MSEFNPSASAVLEENRVQEKGRWILHPRIVLSALALLLVVRAVPAGAREGGLQPRTDRGMTYITAGVGSDENALCAHREFGNDSCV